MKVVYRHFAKLGADSVAAAAATECADEQGKFWEYVDKLFAEQARGVYTTANLKRFGRDIGLDGSKLDACVDSSRYVDRVTRETEAGRTKGVESIPTLFVNGRKQVGLVTFDQLKQMVDAAASGNP